LIAENWFNGNETRATYSPQEVVVIEGRTKKNVLPSLWVVVVAYSIL
jgi:hypothetical protein